MIKHVIGDIFESGADIICHQVNCQGAMNSGVAKQVREKYPNVYTMYKQYCGSAAENTAILLGVAQPVFVPPSQYIVNLFAQDKYGYDGKCYTDYNAFRTCLQQLKLLMNNQIILGRTIAIPYLMGCHRGGGDWNTIYQIIEEELRNYDVTLYEYNGG